jgi:hypothetical protein
MSLLIRKINRAKWPNEKTEKNFLNGHVITVELNAKDNNISLWEIKNNDSVEVKDIDSEETFDSIVEDALLALLTGNDCISTIDIVILESNELMELKMDIKPSEGKTAYTSYKDKHYDVVKVTYECLGNIAEYIHKNIVNERNLCRRYTGSTLKKLLRKAVINDKKIAVDKLPAKLKEVILESRPFV